MSAIGEGVRFARLRLARVARPRPGSTSATRDRYSRRVFLLRRLLPATGISLLLLTVAWPQLSPFMMRMSFKQPAIDPRDARELRMVNPHYEGVDRLGRPYVLTAAIGRQVPNRDDLVAFERPRADLRLNSGMHVIVSSITGVYQAQTQLLDLFDDVDMVRDDGTHFVTGSAHLDLLNNTGEGKDPVVGHAPTGDITAQGFRVLNNGNTIVFTGASVATLRSAKHSTTPAEPPAPPPEVAEVAAQVEAMAAALLAGASLTAAAGATAPSAIPPAASRAVAAPATRKTSR